MRLRRYILVLSLLAPTACLQTIDLREEGHNQPLPQCNSGERLNPDSGKCSVCQVDISPGADVCPCGYISHAEAFPYCEGDAVAHDCVQCSGDISSCVVYHSDTRTTSSCALLEQCCTNLIAVGGSCCPTGALLICTEGENLTEYTVRCTEPTCCSGDLCPNGDDDCASWQTCDVVTQRCVPACSPQHEQCCEECGCICSERPNPP
ncbi:MAG: hypothetical protein JW841_17355 [Deltaproteobacteria bacterium]|nr:hypothetical protein [Deltaproteobacteria bacterium]